MAYNRGDIDIDFSDRDQALVEMPHITASIIKDGKITKHNTGVYFHTVPTDPVTGFCSWDYEDAEQKGMYKIDMLNVSIYSMIRDENHLMDLMSRPLDWRLFEYPEFVANLFHLGNYGDLTSKVKPKSIEDISMLLALIRTGKKHLQERCIQFGFSSIADEIWTHDKSGGYEFKKAHGISYSVLVYVHANLLVEQLSGSFT